MIDHDLHHQVLQDAVNHVESAQSAPGASRPPPHVRRVPGDADAGDPAADPVPMAHKLEFPKFDGTGDPLPWLNRCERFFHMRWTPDDKRVAFTAFYLLDDAQLWFHRMELNEGRPSWP
jgi:hypothetical protein